jgi:hypothetical protein
VTVAMKMPDSDLRTDSLLRAEASIPPAIDR